MNVENLKTELWPLDKIIPYPQNAKLHNVELIAESIKQFKIDQPIAVDAAGVIIKGHGRLKAARSLGLTEFPVVVRTDLTPEQVRLARLADNRSNEGGWDSEMLGIEMRELAMEMPEFDFAALGLSEAWTDDMGATESATSQEETKDKKDIQIEKEFHSGWYLEIDCESERQQQDLYNRFIDEGIKCRVLTL